MDFSNFDKFLSRDTWHTGRPKDLKLFYQCLNEVVDNANFSAEGLGEYIRERMGVSSPDHALATPTDRLVRIAWAMSEYSGR